jgi:hypothetical protein
MVDKQQEYLASYLEYAKTLRAWFVAYGVGAPALFLVNKDVYNSLNAAGNAKTIALLFISAAALQVLLALVNKATMWGVYYGELNPEVKEAKLYRTAHWVSEAFWLDLVIDTATLALFGVATLMVFGAAWATV